MSRTCGGPAREGPARNDQLAAKPDERRSAATVARSGDRARAADLGALITIERNPARPGWLVVTVERARYTRHLWLSLDEAGVLYALLRRELPVVETRAGGHR